MRLTATKIDVVTRTAPLQADDNAVPRLPADGLHGACRLQAYVYFASSGSLWTVHRYAYRLTSAEVGRRNAVKVKLVSDGAVVHVFEPPRDAINDGRWYVHEHTTDVPKTALTYARFEAWFELPGLTTLLRDEFWQPVPSRGTRDRNARARVSSRAGNAQHVQRATERA